MCSLSRRLAHCIDWVRMDADLEGSKEAYIASLIIDYVSYDDN